LCDEHAPLKHVPKRKVKYIDKPWITRDILPYIIAKNKMAKVKNSNPSGFRKVKNYVTGLIRRRHADYLNKYFTEHRNNSKKVWDGIRTALEWNKSKSSSINSVKDTDGNTLTDSKLMADSFAKYFKNIPHKCVTKIPKGLGKPGYSSYMPTANPSSMVLYDTDGCEVFEIINRLKSNKSPGPLPFSNYFLKILSLNLSSILSTLINRSFKEAKMPSCLKVGKQTPVFKSGDNVISNYRPITVVNSIAKIFEKAMAVRLVRYLRHFNIIINNQFGFREHHSTTHAMIKVLDESLKGLDEKDFKTGAVFLDISKAFDCVNHNVLINKLDNYGVRGNVKDWFKSFLTNRSHFVDVNGSTSEPYTPTLGVPQGSVLGPILFILYINDLSHSSNTFSFSIFADDTSLLLKIDRNCYNITLCDQLEKVMDWFSANSLLLNYNKSQYLFLGPHYKNQYISEFVLSDLYEVSPHYLLLDSNYDTLEEQLADNTIRRQQCSLGEHVLEELYEVAPNYLTSEHIVTDYGILVEQDEVKYLGITFDNTLKFTSHIQQTTQKVSKVVGMLWKMRQLPLRIKLNIYHSLIYSHLNYSILIWGHSIAGNLTRGVTGLDHVPKYLKNLNTAHNKAIRALVCASKMDPLSSIFRNLNLLKLVDLYYYNLSIFAFETFVNKSPQYFLNYIDSNAPPRVTRNTNVCDDYSFDFRTDKIYYDQPNLKKTLGSVKYAASAMWNKIPDDIKQAKSLEIFKFSMKRWLTKDYISSREIVLSESEE